MKAKKPKKWDPHYEWCEKCGDAVWMLAPDSMESHVCARCKNCNREKKEHTSLVHEHWGEQLICPTAVWMPPWSK